MRPEVQSRYDALVRKGNQSLIDRFLSSRSPDTRRALLGPSSPDPGGINPPGGGYPPTPDPGSVTPPPTPPPVVPTVERRLPLMPESPGGPPPGPAPTMATPPPVTASPQIGAIPLRDMVFMQQMLRRRLPSFYRARHGGR